MEKEKKKIVITISLIIVLILAVIGVSYAAFSYVGRGEKVNQITTGTIGMDYQESDNIISITNALPTTDETGKVRLKEGEYFDFSVTTNISGGAILNYEIAAEDFADNTFDGANVKFYLTKVVGSEEIEVDDSLPSNYQEVTNENTMTGRPAGMMSLLTRSTSEQGSVTTNYRLRLYVDEKYNPQGDGGSLVFKTRVNVYGRISTDGLVMKKDFLAGNVEKNDITSIVTKNTVSIPDTSIKSWDISELENGNVVAYIEDDGLGNSTYKLTLAGRGSIVAPVNSSELFSEFLNVNLISLSYLDTMNVNNMFRMFLGCSNLTELNINNFDTSSVTTMHGMFTSCSSLEVLDLSNFNTSLVVDMNSMFSACFQLKSLNISRFDTSNVNIMRYMFANCQNLLDLNISSFNTSNVTIMYAMFVNCFELKTLDVSNFNTSNVTDMSRLFEGCRNLKVLDLTNFDISNVIVMDSMFSYCYHLASILANDQWKNVSNNMNMFTECGIDHVTII